jgi:hypothetical protein
MKNTKEKDTKLLTDTPWWLEGLVFGVLMFIIMGIIHPLTTGQTITSKSFSIELPCMLLAGLLYGITMKMIRKSKTFKHKK